MADHNGTAGFSDKQRRWFLRRDGNQCMFHYKVNGKWVRCKNTRNLQIHHLIPRGWASENMPKDFPLNSSGNGITLCDQHHVNKGGRLCNDYVVHPDNECARLSFKSGNHGAYDIMMNKRRELNLRGIPYWNTKWDWLFRRLIDKYNSIYNNRCPEDVFPENRNRNANGKVK